MTATDHDTTERLLPPPSSRQSSTTTQPQEHAMPPSVLLVAHGSSQASGQADMASLRDAVAAAAPQSQIRLGYLELSEPPASTVLDEMIATGADDVVIVPLMLHSAGHAKSDVPAIVLSGRERHPQVRLSYARPLGVDHALLTFARRRLEECGGLGLPLLLGSRGTSDPDANATAYKIGRLMADLSDTRLVVPGFSGMTWPTIPEALAELQRLGAERIVAFAWFLATGVLVDRMCDQYAQFTAETGVEVLDAGYFGVGDELIQLIIERAGEAAGTPVAVNCDTCAYRRPWPGLEDRVGSARGVGHSHLAADHLSHDGHA